VTGFALVAVSLWLITLLLPWRPWSTRERIEPVDSSDHIERGAAGSVSVLIPARNEAATLGQTLDAVAKQAGVVDVVVVDDRSEDETAAIVATFVETNVATPVATSARGMPGVRVIKGRPTPPGWTGKLWAQQQGLEAIDSPLVLLIDADIRLAPGMLDALVDKLEHERLDQVSVMASLPASSWPEKLMLPAFVYFFKQLYPFAWVNRTDRPFSAAAGGCVLVRREILRKAGAFSAWKGALIDDCELACRVRNAGGRIWLGLSRGVESMRRHPDLPSILETVRRTAYTQLRYSRLLLLAVVAMMLVAFAIPPFATVLGLLTRDPVLAGSGLAGWLLMALSFLPQVRFSGLAALWALALPLSAMLFLVATMDSAIRHHYGRGAGWKGRHYQR